MRRTDREIRDFQKMLEILEECDCCRLGFAEADGVYIVPLNFGYRVLEEKVTLYFHSAVTGKKIELTEALERLEQQTKGASCAGFEMDTGHGLVEGESACAYSYLYQSIIGKGKLSVIADEGERRLAMQELMRHYSHRDGWMFQEAMMARIALLKLEVTEWSCKAHVR